MARQAKRYRTGVESDHEFASIPDAARFAIERETAKEIVHFAELVRENRLYKVEKFDYRVEYLEDEPDAVGGSLLTPAHDKNGAIRTEADTLNVSDTDFWFSAYLKHSDIEISTEHCPIAELARHFGIHVKARA